MRRLPRSAYVASSGFRSLMTPSSPSLPCPSLSPDWRPRDCSLRRFAPRPRWPRLSTAPPLPAVACRFRPVRLEHTGPTADQARLPGFRPRPNPNTRRSNVAAGFLRARSSPGLWPPEACASWRRHEPPRASSPGPWPRPRHGVPVSGAPRRWPDRPSESRSTRI
jgi:hypothetical protein